jgi:hypothetical protein
MENTHDKVWVELVGQIIIARILGEPSEELLELRYKRILQIEKATTCKKLLLDDLQMKAPTYADIEKQHALNPELNNLGFKIAIVVPDSQMAYLARLKFNHENHKVFYDDMVEAISWLAQVDHS